MKARAARLLPDRGTLNMDAFTRLMEYVVEHVRRREMGVNG